MKQSTFVAALKFASHVMAIKDTRYYLNGVLFEFKDSRLTLVGTDGHRMAYVELDNAPGECVTTDIIVSAQDVKLLLTALVAKTTGHVEFSFDNGLEVIGRDGRSITCKGIDGKYPDWRRVCKSGAKPTGTETIGVNADYLAAASKACGAFGISKYNGVHMTFHGSNESMLLKPDTLPDGVGEAAVVVMPMRR